MMKSTSGNRMMNRFLKSRVLPVFTVLVLMAGWVFAAGYLLWEIKVKEEFHLTGRFVPDLSAAGKDGTRLVLSVGSREKDLSPIVPGQAVELSLGAEGAGITQFEASFVQWEKTSHGEELVLDLKTQRELIEIKRTDQAGSFYPLKVSLVVRQRRLLSAALDRNPLF